MMFSPSDYCCRFNDQEYLELVFENGQILAKGQRSNVSLQNQRTESIMDLYEAEYNEDFKKCIHDDDVGGVSIKNLGDTQVVPQDHAVAAHETNNLESNKHVSDSTLKASSSKRMMVANEKNQKKIDFTPPDEQSVVAEKLVESGFDSSSTDFSEDSQGWTYLTSSLDDESDDVRPRVPARTRKALVKRKRSAEDYNSPERKQRNDIKKRMRTLQDLIPNSHEDDNESLLDEAISYMTNLQLQVQMMTLSNRFVTPAMMMPLEPHYYQMGLAMGMGLQMGAPQFLPVPVLNHPGQMPLQDSPLPTLTDIRSSQSVPPSWSSSYSRVSK